MHSDEIIPLMSNLDGILSKFLFLKTLYLQSIKSGIVLVLHFIQNSVILKKNFPINKDVK